MDGVLIIIYFRYSPRFFAELVDDGRRSAEATRSFFFDGELVPLIQNLDDLSEDVIDLSIGLDLKNNTRCKATQDDTECRRREYLPLKTFEVVNLIEHNITQLGGICSLQ